jgi:hypothetical protein
MSAPSPPTAYESAAQVLSASAQRPLHERIFHDALNDARAEASNDDDTRLLAKLAVIRDRASMKTALEKELNQDPHTAKRPSRRVARFCGSVDRWFDVAWRISEASRSPPYF